MPSLAAEFRKTPFLKLAIPFICGIICQLIIPINWQASLFLLVFSFLVFLVISLTHFPENFRFGFIWGIALYLIIFAIGLFITSIRIEKLKLPENILQADASVIQLSDLPVTSPKSIKVSAGILAFRYNNKWYSCESQCNIYIATDSLTTNLEAGNKFLVYSKFREMDGPVSPYQFDFKKYFYYKGIQLQLIAKTKNIFKLAEPVNNIQILILKIRHFLVDKLNCPNMGKREKAVVSSLVMGFTGDLDPELRTSYARAGVMHILSVSGMHVGIVYCFLMYLFFFLDRTQKLRIIKSVIIIAGIWFYALVTGFSPPVIRSAAMFSFFAAGQAINRNSNGFNTLAASAFIILLFNPFQIADLGFQLSYTAIAGIMLFYSPIYNAWNPVHWFVDKVWALIAVSVAAQLGTLPLSLYYFHQFPTYFIPTNLLIVPLSGFIIYAGLALLILSFWPLAVSVISFVLNCLLTSLNWLVVHVEFLPGSSIRNLYLNIPETIVLTAMIILIAVWIKNRLHINIIIFFFCILSFATLRAVRLISAEKQKIVIVHNTRGSIALSLVHNHECILLADSAIVSKVENASVNMLLAYNVKKTYALTTENITRDTSVGNVAFHLFSLKNLFIQFEGKKFVLLQDKEIRSFKSNSVIPVDFLMLKDNSGIKLDNALKYFNASKIITGFGYKNNAIKNPFRSEKTKNYLFFVNEQGFFKEDL